MQINPLNEIPIKSGTAANLTLYSGANPYIAPCDGYVFVQSLAAGEWCMADVLAPDGTSVATINQYSTQQYEYNSLYVKKGMKLYGTSSAGSPIYFKGIN